jgi:hypothetical protein
MKCSKCGYERQSRDDAFVPLSECPACGVIYTKHDLAREPTETGGVVPPPHLKPSPVDALSLRKARERVDQRLRERLGTRVKDARHAQTLELAKRLTTEQIHKRRNAWKQAHPEKQSPPHPEKSAPAEQAQGAQALNPGMESPSQGDPPKDRRSMGSDPAGVEKMTAAGTSALETVDSPTVPEGKSSEPVREAEPAAAEASPVDEKAVSGDNAVLDSSAEPVAGGPPEVHQDMGSAQQEPDNRLPETEESTPTAWMAVTQSHQQRESGLGGGLTRLLPIVAWLILVAGVIGAILSWTTIGDVEAGVRIPIPESVNTLPLGLLLGFAYLATGVLGFAFFWVSSLISIQLKDIRRLLMDEERGSGRIQNVETGQ